MNTLSFGEKHYKSILYRLMKDWQRQLCPQVLAQLKKQKNWDDIITSVFA